MKKVGSRWISRAGIACAALLASATAWGGVRVVSDIDDTVKISNSTNIAVLLMNSIFSRRAFTGMQELYASFAIERGYEFEYVTAAPFFWKPSVESFLWDNGFPKGEVHVKSAFKYETTPDYKIRVVKELLARYPDDSFILLGDNGEYDAEVYDALYRFAPARVLAIYIHKIENRPLPPSEYGFVTAFEIARTENLMGRLDTLQTAPVAISILAERDDHRIVPRFMFCPAKREHRFSDPKVEEWNDRVSKRLMDMCAKRHPPAELL